VLQSHLAFPEAASLFPSPAQEKIHVAIDLHKRWIFRFIWLLRCL